MVFDNYMNVCLRVRCSLLQENLCFIVCKFNLWYIYIDLVINNNKMYEYKKFMYIIKCIVIFKWFILNNNRDFDLFYGIFYYIF